jgi:DNA-binding NarL/FixJ family response regulator
MRILVVDDNDVVRRGIVGILESRPDFLVCGEASDGEEAIQKARDLLPDLILLDVSMPGMNGLDAARRLRQDSAQVKILLTSQHDPAQLRPGALEAGANGCVDKGRLVMDLLPCIEALAAAAASASDGTSDSG